jgi:hypothetical protein
LQRQEIDLGSSQQLELFEIWSGRVAHGWISPSHEAVVDFELVGCGGTEVGRDLKGMSNSFHEDQCRLLL